MISFAQLDNGFKNSLQRHWPGDSFYLQLSAAKLESMFENITSLNKHVLLSDCGNAVQGWKGQDKIEIEFLSHDQLKNIFEGNATTLKFQNVQKHIDAFAQFMDEVLFVVRTPAHRTYCNVYLSPPGKKTAMHFDEHEVIILQVQGSKQWAIAPNTSVAWPTFGYFGKPVPNEYNRQIVAPFPSQMPDTSKEYTLSPGSLLFLPRGTWHETEAITESLSITFTFESKTRMDIISPLFIQHLIADPEWRKVAAKVNQRNIGDDLSEISTINSLVQQLGELLCENGIEGLLESAQTK